MEAISLSIVLLMSGAAQTAEPANSGARAQAVARARIVRGESIAFTGPDQPAMYRRSKDTYYLPLARSRQVRPDSTGSQLVIQEFQ